MNLDTALSSQKVRLRRRVRVLLVERYGLFGGGIGAIAAAILVLLSSRFTGLLDWRLWICAVIASVLGGCAVGLIRKLDDLTVAIAADRRTGLKERLSTAVAVSVAGGMQDMERAVVQDACEHFARLRARDVFRRRFGRPHIVFGLALLLLLVIVIFPRIPAFQSQARRQEVAVMKREGAKIVKISKEIRKESGRDQQGLRKLAAKLEKLGEKMQSCRMSKKQAVLKTRRLSKEIEREQDRLAGRNSGVKTMEQARAEMRKASRDLTREMAGKIAARQGIPPEEAVKQVACDKRLAELARKAGPLTEAERQELEQAIAKYADPNSLLPIPAELAEALAKLAENKDYRKAMELMQKLAQKLDCGKMGEMDKELLKKQMEQLAKALKNTDLDKLAKQMLESAEKLAKMSPEELKKLLEDMKKAQMAMKMLAKAGGG